MRGKSGLEYLKGESKRRLDFFGGVAIASALLPVTGAAAIAASATNRSWNPYFRQTREGKDGKPLEVVKFRTLPEDVNNGLVQVLGAHDPRASLIGRVLRQSGMDELPQLGSVIQGDMSLVGIRPLLPESLEAMEAADPRLFRAWDSLQQQTKPGLTGPGQLDRRRFKEQGEEQMVRSMMWEISYIRQASLGRDLRILGGTPLALLKARIHRIDNSGAETVPVTESV